MNIENFEIRKMLFEKQIRFNRLARIVGVDPNTITRWLACPLNDERRGRILDAVSEYEKQYGRE